MKKILKKLLIHYWIIVTHYRSFSSLSVPD